MMTVLRNLWLGIVIVTMSWALMMARFGIIDDSSSEIATPRAWHSDLFKSANHGVPLLLM